MKAIFINGSPRKNKNTAQMLEAAMKGAQEAGAEVEMIHLYGLNYKGCMSCFFCKRKGRLFIWVDNYQQLWTNNLFLVHFLLLILAYIKYFLYFCTLKCFTQNG